MNELLITACESEIQIADSLEHLDPKGCKEDIEACDFFVCKTNEAAERILHENIRNETKGKVTNYIIEKTK